MKKRIAIIATAVIIVATLVVGGTLAFFTDKGEVQNVITTGNVKITLTEPAFKDSTGNTFKLGDVMPGQKITKDPTITNTGDHDAYIRCKVTVEGLPSNNELEFYPAHELMHGLNIGPNWVLNNNDGYYYYQSPLPKKPASGDSKVQLFNTVTIPERWDNALANKEFKINVSAEAIQVENFKPHMTGNVIDGWKYSDNTDVQAQP